MHKNSVLTPANLLPSQWVPVLDPTYLLPRRVDQVFTLHQRTAKKTIRYVMLHFRDLRDAASLAVTEIALLQPFLYVNRSPVQYDFHGGAKAIRYCVNMA